MFDPAILSRVTSTLTNRVIEFASKQRGEHQIGAAKRDELNLQIFFIEKSLFVGDDVRQGGPTADAGPAEIDVLLLDRTRD